MASSGLDALIGRHLQPIIADRLASTPVVESDEGPIAAVEIKAKASIDDKDFRGLRMLRDRLGTDFVGGAVINLGTRSYRYDDRLYVMPLDRLWTPQP